MDTNLRSIKLEPEGYTVLSKSERTHKDLCNHCCLASNCNQKRNLDRIQRRHDLSIRIEHCNQMILPVVFRDDRGLGVDGCNTMRLGKAWSKRVTPGTKVGLVCDNETTIARVTEVHVLPKQEAFEKHGKMNHMLIEEKLNDQEAKEKIAKVMRDSYGKLIYDNNDDVTVMYLEAL